MVKTLRFIGLAGLLALVFGCGMAFQRFGVPMLKKSTYFQLQEPLQLEVLEPGARPHDLHLLPVGTPLYFDHAFPEGHTRYIVYVNIKAKLAAKKIISDERNLIAPIWAEPVTAGDPSEPTVVTEVPKDARHDGPFPEEVGTFIARREGCDHFRGEIPDPGQRARAREVDREINRLCKGTDMELARLKQKYATTPDVMAALNEFESSIEMPSKKL